MKNGPKTEALLLLLVALPFIYLAFTWNSYPDQVPIHFNHQGTPDRYAGKAVGLLLLPATNVFVYLLLKFLPRIDPRYKNYALFEGRYTAIRLAIQAFMVFIFFLITSAARTGAILSPKLLFIALAIFFMILGNYLSAVRPNYFVGVRTPWTLDNEEVWKKTHRFTGRLWVLSSLVLLIVTLFLENPHPALLIAVVVLISFLPIVYSYLVYRKIGPKNGALH